MDHAHPVSVRVSPPGLAVGILPAAPCLTAHTAACSEGLAGEPPSSVACSDPAGGPVLDPLSTNPPPQLAQGKAGSVGGQPAASSHLTQQQHKFQDTVQAMCPYDACTSTRPRRRTGLRSP